MYVAFPSWHARVKLRKRGFLNNVNSRKRYVERTQLYHGLYKTSFSARLQCCKKQI